MKSVITTYNQLCLFDNDAIIKSTPKKDEGKKTTTETKLIREKIAVYGIDKLIPEEVLSVLTGLTSQNAGNILKNIISQT